MATAVGHVFPGLCSFVLGFYYAVLVSLALLRGQKFQILPLPPKEKRPKGWLKQLPIEGLVKVILAASGILGELFYPLGSNRFAIIDWEDPERKFLYHNSWQHMTMYAFFIISGLVDIVSRGWLAKQQMKLEQAALTLALVGITLLFTSHIQGKDVLQVHSHLLLLLPLIVTTLIMITEFWFPDQTVLWVSKIWMFLLFGSWFIQLAFILYLPMTGQPWRADRPEDIMFLTTFFCWHLILNALLIIGIYGLCSLWCHLHPSWKGVKNAEYHPCPTDSTPEELMKLMVQKDSRI